MDSIKERILQGLKDDFSPELKTFLTKTLPTVEIVSYPQTVDEAFIVQGKCAASLMAYMSVLSGLPVIELLLKVGQLNSTLHGILLASVEIARTPVPHTIVISRPGSPQVAGVVLFELQITSGIVDLNFAVVTINGNDELLTVSETNETFFETSKTLSVGYYTAEFSAFFAGYRAVATTSFDVIEE